jgi:uncharacterized protein YbaR (Trm112 family)
MIRPELLELLRCPETRQKLHPAGSDLLLKVNFAIKAGEIRNRAGKILEQQVEDGLIREDGAVLYPIRGKLPILLIDEAIDLPTLPS